MNRVLFYNNLFLRNTSIIKRLIKYIFNEHNIYSYSVNIVFVNKNYIRILNKKYRNKDKATDILTFNMFDKSNENTVMGDIYICVDMIEDNNVNGITMRIIHGILHLIGFVHNTVKGYNVFMKKQKKYLLIRDKL